MIVWQITLLVLIFSQEMNGFRWKITSVISSKTRSSLVYMKLETSKMNSRLMEQFQNSQLMIEALRGRNLNDNDQQMQGIDMKVVEVTNSKTDETDRLPLIYDPIQLQRYFSKRPLASAQRLWQVLSVSSSYLFGVLTDLVTGNTEDIEVRRAAELRNTIVSLGPFFIKLGQALSIRPDILSPKAMIELQQLCDKVPSFDNKLAMKTIEEELGKPIEEVFSEISPSPMAAASLGQVYQARLKSTNDTVAVKVQRPFVLETVSLDLYLMRQIGVFLRNFPSVTARMDIVALLDQFANNFYQELDYQLECDNGLRIMEDMKRLPQVVIPRPYPELCTRRVHTAQWIEGEKLSQSKANDVNSLVNLGVITYLTQLLDTGFFHADPHPGNMLRTPDGKLVILDFGLMTRITDDQKYGMIEAIAHLIHRDYDQIGKDFINLDFIPRDVDVSPIIPVLTRVFEAALAGGGAKSINFQELAADLAEITFKYPFRIPPYFALIIRAISVLEGIALVGNPEFAIVDEAYPFIAKKLLTDRSDRARQALRYMIYGKSDTLDVERLIDILVALEKFIAVKEFGDGSSFKVKGVRGGVYVGKAGDSVGTKELSASSSPLSLAMANFVSNVQLSNSVNNAEWTDVTDVEEVSPSLTTTSIQKKESTVPVPSASMREALKFFFSVDGNLLREFVLDEISNGIDAVSRDAFRELLKRFRILPSASSKQTSLFPVPFGFFPLPGLAFPSPLTAATSTASQFLNSVAPELTEKDQKVVDSLFKLTNFFLGNTAKTAGSGLLSSLLPFPLNGESPMSAVPAAASSEESSSKRLDAKEFFGFLLSTVKDEEKRRQLTALFPTIKEFWPNIEAFLLQVNRKLFERLSGRVMNASLDAIFGPSTPSSL